MTNEIIHNAIRHDQRVYAILNDGSRDVIYGIAWSKVAGRNGVYHTSEIVDYVIESI